MSQQGGTYILHKLGVVELVEHIDSVRHGGAGGTDRTIQLIHRAGDQMRTCKHIVLQEVHLL